MRRVSRHRRCSSRHRRRKPTRTRRARSRTRFARSFGSRRSPSESTTDCAPYEPGKSEIKRRFTVEHVFRAGSYRVMFKLKRREKPVASAGVSIQVRPGLRDIG
ncbi:MAG: hypothetical protein AUI11_10195 [Acidobacteria bacterium 13_2_20CM_2_66_4]|nr:MAG: hypothetical protein AUI11_10195 [Acidobacteria bacterium 13_2_20CM_2_66_4]